MSTIIDKNIDALKFNELRDFMYHRICESIDCLDKNQTEQISWYKDCGMYDYFNDFSEIWDENDEKIGVGIDTIANQFILNEDTCEDFKTAFLSARDAAYDNAINYYAERVEDFVGEGKMQVIEIENTFSEIEKREIENEVFTESEIIASRFNEKCDELEKSGYKLIISDSNEETEFYNDFIEDVYQKATNICISDMAVFFGAKICVSVSYSDNFRKDYYKK